MLLLAAHKFSSLFMSLAMPDGSKSVNKWSGAVSRYDDDLSQTKECDLDDPSMTPVDVQTRVE